MTARPALALLSSSLVAFALLGSTPAAAQDDPFAWNAPAYDESGHYEAPPRAPRLGLRATRRDRLAGWDEDTRRVLLRSRRLTIAGTTLAVTSVALLGTFAGMIASGGSSCSTDYDSSYDEFDLCLDFSGLAHAMNASVFTTTALIGASLAIRGNGLRRRVSLRYVVDDATATHELRFGMTF